MLGLPPFHGTPSFDLACYRHQYEQAGPGAYRSGRVQGCDEADYRVGEQRQRVTLGACSSEMVLRKAAGATHCATGKFLIGAVLQSRVLTSRTAEVMAKLRTGSRKRCYASCASPNSCASKRRDSNGQYAFYEYLNDKGGGFYLKASFQVAVVLAGLAVGDFNHDGYLKWLQLAAKTGSRNGRELSGRRTRIFNRTMGAFTRVRVVRDTAQEDFPRFL